MKERTYAPGESPSTEWEKFALSFVETLVAQRYEQAHLMLAGKFRAEHSVEWLRSHIERLLVQSQEPFGPCHVFMSNPGPEPTDLGMSYVVIGGEFNEAISPIVVSEAGQFRVRDLFIGRP